jgi:sterol desaturase/sphingolipid hydroxylase (fatty acid hydroxylase superfamily)
VHHIDRDMDASTALRFHLIDMMLAVPLRLVQVRVFGASPRALAAWEGFFLGSVLFHHADLDLPFDRELAWLLTTPGMHDIHHRADPASLDSNYSAGLSFWDRMHGTFADVVPPVPIGVPGETAEEGLLPMLALPWREGL